MNIVKAIRAAAAAAGPGDRGSVVMTTTQPQPTTTPEIGGIGHSVKRHEDDRFIEGQGNYLDDHTLPGMLHMAILRSPVAHARIKSIDTSAAAAIDGVVAVVTGELLASYNLAWMPTLSGDTQAVLATDKVRFQGQEVAAVVATDPYIAEDALELIDVDYEILPAITTPQQSLGRRRGADPRREGRPDRQPGLRVGERRRGRDRRRVRQGRPGRHAGDASTRARTRRRWRRAASSPTSTRSAGRRRST